MEGECNSLTYVKTSQLLTDLKKCEETAWLSEVDSMALQESLRNLDRAFQNFFAKRAGYPRYDRSIVIASPTGRAIKANGIRIISKRIKLSKIGLVRIKQSRDFNGRILSATVSPDCFEPKYYVSLCRSRKRILALPKLWQTDRY